MNEILDNVRPLLAEEVRPGTQFRYTTPGVSPYSREVTASACIHRHHKDAVTEVEIFMDAGKIVASAKTPVGWVTVRPIPKPLSDFLGGLLGMKEAGK